MNKIEMLKHAPELFPDLEYIARLRLIHTSKNCGPADAECAKAYFL